MNGYCLAFGNARSQRVRQTLVERRPKPAIAIDRRGEGCTRWRQPWRLVLCLCDLAKSRAQLIELGWHLGRQIVRLVWVVDDVKQTAGAAAL